MTTRNASGRKRIRWADLPEIPGYTYLRSLGTIRDVTGGTAHVAIGENGAVSVVGRSLDSDAETSGYHGIHRRNAGEFVALIQKANAIRLPSTRYPDE